MRRLSIRTKLFLAFTLCMNLIIGLLSYLYLQQTSNVIWERNREASQQMLFRFSSSVDRIYKDIDRISAQIMYDMDINNHFDSPKPNFDDSYPTFVKLLKLTTLLQNLNGPALTAKRIIIFNLNGDYIDYGLNWDTYPRLSDRFSYADWIQPVLSKNGDKQLIPPRPTEWQSTGEVVFSIARSMNSRTIIEIQQPYTLLEQTITAGITPESAARIYIYDDAGRIFYPYKLPRTPFNADRSNGDPNGTEIVHSETGETNIINLTHSSYTGLNIALLQPKAVLLKPIRQLHMLSYIIIGAAELLALLFSYWIARTITSPILKLQRFVRKVELDNVPTALSPVDFKYSYEVNELYETFVKMTLGLHSSMNQVIDLQQRQNIAQMQALYAQMNPHFLYNTLSSIGRRAEESADPQVAQMCYKLTKMMRYSTISLAEPVEMQEELTHAVSYLELMKLRYEHQFHYEAKCDSTLEIESVPKLILQPLLENSFSHGFLKVEPPWTLRIVIQHEPADVHQSNQWSIAIIDNGIGFEPAALARIQGVIDLLHSGQALELQSITSRGLGNVGMENTLTRCRMYWGDRVRFTLRNLIEGSEVKLLIQRIEE
ncbi:sensor histidine kinase [Paenibacillus nasutitermitis]|uniref:Histidine kinase n=1 Tax=Paenibacillus nasutitermitis TaxID=1652958 RepID=A0A916YW22_9BACL|nr:histidine kinase [Paenibacillus nasutitermitis]GGD62220.1 histidine kinase [Paenibacillus nasutitermitis]